MPTSYASLGLNVGSEILGFWYGNWYPGTVRSFISDSRGGPRLEVLWDEENSLSILEVHEVKPKSSLQPNGAVEAKAAPPTSTAASASAFAASGSQGQAAVAQPVPAVATPTALADESCEELVWLEQEGVTSSEGFLNAQNAEYFYWVCHMCRKKMSTRSAITSHLSSNVHVYKRQLQYTLEDWITHNATICSFYDMPPPSVASLRQAAAEASRSREAWVSSPQQQLQA